MSYTDKITCPHCHAEIELEVSTRYDEPDDIEIEPISKRHISNRCKSIIALIQEVDEEIQRGGNDGS